LPLKSSLERTFKGRKPRCTLKQFKQKEVFAMIKINILKGEMAKDSSWEVINRYGVAINVNVEEIELMKKNSKEKNSEEITLVYGSSDPWPNPAELILLQETAVLLNLKWKFFIYTKGKNHPLAKIQKDVSNGNNFKKNKVIFDLEEIIKIEDKLDQIAEEIFKIRGDVIIARHKDDEMRAKNLKEKKDENFTIENLHQEGGWLGGNAIHYYLRKWMTKENNLILLTPYTEKGLIFKMYDVLKKRCLPIFSLFISPVFYKWNENWVPISWREWRALNKKTRKEIRREVKKIIEQFLFKGEKILRVDIRIV
jgi:hypothetical protein